MFHMNQNLKVVLAVEPVDLRKEKVSGEGVREKVSGEGVSVDI